MTEAIRTNVVIDPGATAKGVGVLAWVMQQLQRLDLEHDHRRRLFGTEILFRCGSQSDMWLDWSGEKASASSNCNRYIVCLHSTMTAVGMAVALVDELARIATGEILEPSERFELLRHVREAILTYKWTAAMFRDPREAEVIGNEVTSDAELLALEWLAQLGDLGKTVAPLDELDWANQQGGER